MSKNIEVVESVSLYRAGSIVVSLHKKFYDKFKNAINTFCAEPRQVELLAMYGNGCVKSIDTLSNLESLATKDPADYPIVDIVANHLDNKDAYYAIKTLQELGYTKKVAGVKWKPPIGEKPDFDLIDIVRHAPEGATHFEKCEGSISYLKSVSTGWEVNTGGCDWINQEMINDFMNIRSLEDARRIISKTGNKGLI